VTHLGRAITKSEGLADIHVFLIRGVEKHSVDVQLAELKVAGGCDCEEEAEAAMRMTGENVSV
jgi:hypothetical protein